MRLVNLDLERYGPFTGQSLAFQPEAKLQIVYGPNEAGKSCALAAVTDLFFGIEARTRYDFLHEGTDLRIGATIERRDGARLVFHRRKGNKNTLLDAAGAPLSDDALLPFLGSLSRDVFRHAFGLNTATLQAGADEMLKSGGEVGASLFAAASGLRGLTDLRRSMDAEADGVFGRRATKDRVFYQALDRFEAARKAIRERELRSGDWKALNEKIEERGGKLEQIKQDRGKNATEHARLSRLKRVAPLLRQIDGDLGALALLGDLPDVPNGFTERLRGALDALAKGSAACEEAAAERQQAEQDLAEISVDEALLDRSGDIERLVAETGAYANDRRDRPRIQAEADEYSASLNRLAIRLGLADAALVEKQQPSDTALARTRQLIAKGKALDQVLSGHTRALASEAEARAALERNRTERGAPVDPRPFREELVALAPVLQQLDRRSEMERALAAESRSLGEAAARLDPPIADLDALAEASTPAPETISRFRHQLDGLAENIRRAEERVAAAAETAAGIASKLSELISGRPIPSAESIAEERNKRDEAWLRLRGSIIGTTEPLAGASLTETIVTFEQHSAEADRLADSAASDAERVAAHAAETHRLAEEQRAEADAKGRVEALEEQRRVALEAWRAAWAPAGITPLPPTEMAVWLSSVKALFERRTKRDALKDEVARIDRAIAAILPALQALADELALPPVDGLDTALLARRIEGRLDDIGANWDEARDFDIRGRDIQARIDKLRRDEAEAIGQIETWAKQWQEAAVALGLPGSATTDEAEAALQAWRDVPGVIRERDNRARRVTGMRRNVENFEKGTTAFAEAVAGDLLSLPSDLAMKALAERLTNARGAEIRRDQATKRLNAATRAQAAADTKREEADAAIVALATSLPPGTDLPDLLQRLAGRDQIAASLAERRSQLLLQGDGFTEEQLRADLAAFDIDEAEAALKGLVTDDEDLDRQSQEVFAERDRAMRERAALEQGVGAEIALQQRRNAEAELVDAAREWTILKLGALLIGQVIDRHRTSQQDPMMTRAGALFSTLTGGSFAGLGQDFDDDDIPHLVGRRASGDLISVDGLSEGARDQLYLALRLAYLEDYAARTEAVPFIGDDLFTSFDEDRTAKGLAALAAIGDRVQPILFTHHRHVVDIARKAIGSDVAVIELDRNNKNREGKNSVISSRISSRCRLAQDRFANPHPT